MSKLKSCLTRTSGRISKQILRLEPLEDRQLLSTCHVTRLTDQGIGKGFRGDLRYCINKVNAEPGPDAIDFAVTGTINITAPLPDLASEISIQGPGLFNLEIGKLEIAARIFTVSSAGVVSISGMTVTRGGVDGDGGGIHNSGTLVVDRVRMLSNNASQNGAGVYNSGTLTIHDSIIEQHDYVHIGDGGAIYNTGELIIYDSRLTENMASNGGAIYSTGVASIYNSVISQNQAGSGGGIYNSGILSMTSSSVDDNQANKFAGSQLSYGGGVVNQGMMWIDSSFVGNNTIAGSKSYGGGICNCTDGTLVVRNSTIANNTAGFGGGGIMSFGPVAMIDHSTIAGNGAKVGGGMWSFEDNTVNIRNTILAKNTTAEVELGPDFVGQINSLGHNLIGETTSGGGYHATDILDVDPMLGPLADNGGLTLTLALLPGSPAIDAGDNADAPEWDQRGPGFPRIVNGTIDIGAFEVQATPAPSAPYSPALLITADLVSEDAEAIDLTSHSSCGGIGLSRLDFTNIQMDLS